MTNDTARAPTKATILLDEFIPLKEAKRAAAVVMVWVLPIQSSVNKCD
jgi:hypothetical protein